jgi:hypothetical protein
MLVEDLCEAFELPVQKDNEGPMGSPSLARMARSTTPLLRSSASSSIVRPTWRPSSLSIGV